MIKLKNIFAFILAISITAGAGFYLNLRIPEDVANASSSQNVSGFAWSENVGWISFNSLNCTTDPRPAGCPTGSVPDYGVNIDASTGIFSGHAWSENAGWISFDRAETGTPPGSPYNGSETYIAKLNTGTNQVSGWARALIGKDPASAGWDGWIKLSGSWANGVVYSPASCYLNGFAWGADVIGWTKFQGTAQNGSPYGVLYHCPPTAEGLVSVAPDYCNVGPAYSFRWTFKDVNPGDSQTAYQVQVFEGSTLIKDSGKISSSSNTYAPPSGIFAYNKTYSWQLKVWDSTDLSSAWISGGSFTTLKHQPPTPDFTWVTDPDDEHELTFTDQSEAFGGSSVASRSWIFPDGSPGTSSASSQTVTFSSTGTKNIYLKVTDTDGYACPVTKSVGVRKKFNWKEILPW
jgi:hypothetical protein